MKCPQHYLTEMQEVILFYNGLDVPTKTDARSRKYNLGRETKKVNEKVYAAQVGCEQRKGPYYTKDCPHSKKKVKPLKKLIILSLVHPSNKEGNIEQQLWDSTKEIMQILRIKNEDNQKKEDLEVYLDLLKQTRRIMSRKTISRPNKMLVRNPIRRIESSRYAVSYHPNTPYRPNRTGPYGLQCLDAYSYGATRVDDSLPRKEKDSGSFTLPCYINNVCLENALADLRASVSVMLLSTYLNLGLGVLAHTKLTLKLADRTVTHPKGIVENVLVGIGKFVFPEDFIILDQVDDLMPTIEEGEVIDEPMIDIIKTRNNEIVENMDGYRDQDMGDVIFREPFCKASCVEARRFDGFISIHNGNLRTSRIQVEGYLMTSNNVTFIASFIPLIMEYLVKFIKKARILELKRRHLKKLTLTSYMPYPSRKIWRICACTLQETTKIESLIRQHGDDVAITKRRRQDFHSNGVMEQYISKTRADYGSSIARPKIDDKDHFELKGQFLKELRDNTFSGSDYEDANEHIEKVLEIVDLFHVPNITQDQIMIRVFPINLTGAASRWLRNKPSGLIKT
ncbi:hypothetical protein Tco_1281828 [Tanacetum coccineum]